MTLGVLRKTVRAALREGVGFDGQAETYLIVIAAEVRGEVESGKNGFTVAELPPGDDFTPGNRHAVLLWKKVESDDEETVIEEAERVSQNVSSYLDFEEDDRAPTFKSGHVMVHFVNADAAVWSSADPDDPAYLFDGIEAHNAYFHEIGVPLPAPPRRRRR